MDWLTREVFTAPTWLNEPEILERLGPNSGGFANISRRQAQILDRLVDPRRMATLSELEVTQSEGAYPLAEFLDDVRDAVWGDLRATSAIDGYRRALQRAYLERLEYVMTEEPASNPRSRSGHQQLGHSPTGSRTTDRTAHRSGAGGATDSAPSERGTSDGCGVTDRCDSGGG